jgi:CRP/FNR family transcriptional regulator, nitrogen fixation regulation protein
MWASTSNARDWELTVLEAEISAAPPIDADPIGSIGTLVSFPRNRQIYCQNDPALHIYKIINGSVRTCRHFADGRRQVGAFYLAEDVFGFEMDAVHALSAEAINSSKILVIRRSALISMAERKSDVALRLWAVTTRELRRADDHILLLMKTAPERVASFLLMQAEHLGNYRSIDLPMSRRDIADYLGLTIETVSRTLSDLQTAGAIRLPTSHRVVFRNRTALEKLRG